MKSKRWMATAFLRGSITGTTSPIDPARPCSSMNVVHMIRTRSPVLISGCVCDTCFPFNRLVIRPTTACSGLLRRS